MAPITIDTNLMIWGLKGEATAGQEEMIERTQRFLENLTNERIPLMLTSQTVAEYLGGFPPDRRASQYRLLTQHYPVIPFDLRAAEIAADLLYDKKLIKRIQKEHDVSRQVVKADITIIASAVAAGISTLYSHDGKFIKAAQGKILVKELPPLPSPTTPVEKTTPKHIQAGLFDRLGNIDGDDSSDSVLAFLQHLRSPIKIAWGRVSNPLAPYQSATY